MRDDPSPPLTDIGPTIPRVQKIGRTAVSCKRLKARYPPKFEVFPREIGKMDRVCGLPAGLYSGTHSCAIIGLAGISLPREKIGSRENRGVDRMSAHWREKSDLAGFRKDGRFA